MKKLIAALSLILLCGCSTVSRLEKTGSNITWADKTQGSTLTAEDVNQIKTAVNSKQDSATAATDAELAAHLASADEHPAYQLESGMAVDVPANETDPVIGQIIGIPICNGAACAAAAAGTDYLAPGAVTESDISDLGTTVQMQSDMATAVPSNETDGYVRAIVGIIECDGTDCAAAVGATYSVVELADTDDITEVYMKYAVIFYDGAGNGQFDIVEPATDYEISFEVQNRSASVLSLGWDASGENPYLNDVQVGADNEIDLAAGASLLVTRRDESGVYVWRCYMTWGTSSDGGADD
jgi:hypothetical protein